MATLNLGDLALLRRDYKRALAFSNETLTLYTELGDQEGRSFSFCNTAVASFRLGDYDRARSCATESLVIAHELGDTLVIASVCAVASAMALAQGSAEEAARLGNIVDRLLGVAGSQLARTEKELHDETQTLLSEQLDPEQLARLQAAAEAMSIEKATDYALQSLAASPVLTE